MTERNRKVRLGSTTKPHRDKTKRRERVNRPALLSVIRRNSNDSPCAVESDVTQSFSSRTALPARVANACADTNGTDRLLLRCSSSSRPRLDPRETICRQRSVWDNVSPPSDGRDQRIKPKPLSADLNRQIDTETGGRCYLGS